MKRENKKSPYYQSCRVSWDFYFSFWLVEIRSIYEKVKGSYLTITSGFGLLMGSFCGWWVFVLVFYLNMVLVTNMKTVVIVPSH